MSHFYIDLSGGIWYNRIRKTFFVRNLILDKKNFIKDNLFVFICAAVTFIGVLSTAIIFKQNPIKTLPLFISLYVMFLNARVSRYAFLVGGLNSTLYAVSYALMGLYANAVYAFIVSFPLQLMTFFNWKKNTSGGITELRKMTWAMRGCVLLAFAIIWPLVYFAVSSLPGADQSILDVTGTLLGILVTILSMLRFSEYAPLNLVSIAISLTTHTVIFLDDVSNITYVIFTVYSGICITSAIVRMKKARLVR